MKKILLTICVMVLGVPVAYAGTVTDSLNVSATAVGTCSVTTTAVSFGSYDATADVQASGLVGATCSSGLPYTMALDAGLNYIIGSGRHVAAGTNIIAYELYVDAARTTLWGDGGTTHPGAVHSFLGSGGRQSHSVWGTLSSGSSVPTGRYTDIVNVTVNF